LFRVSKKTDCYTVTVLEKIGSAATAARVQVMRRPPLATTLAVASILTVAVGVRTLLRGAEAGPVVEPTAEVLPPAPPSVPVQNVPSDRVAERAAEPAAKIASEPTPVVQPQKPTIATGSVRLNIIPWGAVYIDGEKFGVAPPLRDIALRPGTHRIEVRNPGFASFLQDVEVSAGEEITIRHRFR